MVSRTNNTSRFATFILRRYLICGAYMQSYAIILRISHPLIVTAAPWIALIVWVVWGTAPKIITEVRYE